MENGFPFGEDRSGKNIFGSAYGREVQADIRTSQVRSLCHDGTVFNTGGGAELF